MAQIPYQPQNVTAEQADGNILISWQGSLGATSYQIQRSTDGVNFSNYATVATIAYFVDSLPGIGIMYYYQVAGVNAAGTSPYSTIVQMVAAPPSEMSLYELRMRSYQTADRLGSDFVTIPEANAFARLALYELYDLLIGSYEDYFSSNQVQIQTNGSVQNYALPDGVTNYLGGQYTGTTGTPAPALYKLTGVDLGVNPSLNQPARVTINRYDFVDRNQYVYPNSNSTIYGVFNMRYRMMGTAGNNQTINFIPTPSGGQIIYIWYASKLAALLKDTDLTTIGFSGWLRYVIVRTAKYMLDKEEGSDTSKLDAELLFLKTRIEQMAQNRDIGQADTISETRKDGIWGGSNGGNNGSNGGW